VVTVEGEDAHAEVATEGALVSKALERFMMPTVDASATSEQRRRGEG
jgi:hypothetical protein